MEQKNNSQSTASAFKLYKLPSASHPGHTVPMIRTSFQQIPNAKQQNHEESFKTSSFHASTSMFTLKVLPALALFVKVPSRVGSLLAKAREVDVSANSMLERDLTGVLPAIDPLKVKVYLSVVPSPKKNIFN